MLGCGLQRRCCSCNGRGWWPRRRVGGALQHTARTAGGQVLGCASLLAAACLWAVRSSTSTGGSRSGEREGGRCGGAVDEGGGSGGRWGGRGKGARARWREWVAETDETDETGKQTHQLLRRHRSRLFLILPGPICGLGLLGHCCDCCQKCWEAHGRAKGRPGRGRGCSTQAGMVEQRRGLRCCSSVDSAGPAQFRAPGGGEREGGMDGGMRE